MKVHLVALIMCYGLFSGCAISKTSTPLPSAMETGQVQEVMTRVADWQLDHPSRHALTDWTHGALFAGMTAWAQMADSDRYEQALIEFGNKSGWRVGRRRFHADDYCVGQMYIDMYKLHDKPEMIQPIQENLDYILEHPPTSELEMVQEGNQDRWNWCDALFMGPPVWAKLARVTGDEKYLDHMNKEWWATTDFLYDKDEHLYYRDSRYFDRREANGEKVFWSRGNGWVFGGLIRVLEQLPDDYPDRQRYETLFKQMAAKLIDIQPEEGLWHSSLLDPVGFPSIEASGSGFYCYGLAWGINRGYLDEKTYLPAVIKAWTGLVGCVHPDGKLGYVQPIGADPRHVNTDQTEIYGVGSFLLAGSEVYKIAIRDGQDVTTVAVTNPGLFFRNSETLELDNVSGQDVFDLQTNKFLLTQSLEEKLLFQTDLAPGDKKSFWVMDRPDDIPEPDSTVRTFCRFIAERSDDFGWENDKTAYRMYGPALEWETITCGIDAWGKSVPYPIIDKFMRDYTEKNIPYHEDHGEGADFYKVGNTLGCGAMAPFVDEKVCLSNHNFSEWKVIANGPIRSIFELTYKPWKAGSYTVSETKQISIDLGSNLNRIECRYSCEDAETLPVAAGIILRETSDQTWTRDQSIAYWLPSDGHDYGMLGCGVVFGSEFQPKIETADSHLLLTLNQDVSEPVVYYSGACWDKNEEFSSFEKWQDYLKNFKARLDAPVKVKTE